MSAISGIAHAAAPAGYKITELNSIAGTVSWASAINDSGYVAGRVEIADNPDFWSKPRAFLHNGSAMEIGMLAGDTASSASAINNAGVVVGTSFVASPRAWANRAIAWDGSLSDFGTSAYYRTDPSDINNGGAIVGSYHAGPSSFPSRPHAFLHSNGVTTDLGTLGGSYSVARQINDSGKVIGRSAIADDAATRGFIYENGAMTALGTLGGTDSQADAINNLGHIVGTSDIAGNAKTHAFLYVDGVMTDLGSMGMLAQTNSYALSINDAGHVVGYADGATGRQFFLYADGVMQDLGSLLGQDSGWTIKDVAGINANGQIALTAEKLGFGTQALRLDPVSSVPEPAPWAMLGAGLLVAVMRSRRQADGALERDPA